MSAPLAVSAHRGLWVPGRLPHRRAGVVGRLGGLAVPVAARLRQLLRVVGSLEGAVHLRVEVVPRFDYGQVRPWIRRAGPAWQALGGDDGLVIEATCRWRCRACTT
jgi:hypothetical protein